MHSSVAPVLSGSLTVGFCLELNWVISSQSHQTSCPEDAEPDHLPWTFFHMETHAASRRAWNRRICVLGHAAVEFDCRAFLSGCTRFTTRLNIAPE